MLSNPIGQFTSRNLTAGNAKNKGLLLVCCCAYFAAIHHKKDFHRSMAYPFVTVHERMILNQSMSKRPSFRCKSRIKIYPIKCHCWLGNSRFERTLIPKAPAPA